MKRATIPKFFIIWLEFISIHALVKRATSCFIKFVFFGSYFNPRPREEGDESLRTIGNVFAYFNPRPREEGDLFQRFCCQKMYHFNPRPREEGDSNTTGNRKTDAYFNPRPREEGDKTHQEQVFTITHFNPRPREEGDLARSPSRSIAVISIHALVKRATGNVKGTKRRNTFLSTPS